MPRTSPPEPILPVLVELALTAASGRCGLPEPKAIGEGSSSTEPAEQRDELRASDDGADGEGLTVPPLSRLSRFCDGLLIEWRRPLETELAYDPYTSAVALAAPAPTSTASRPTVSRCSPPAAPVGRLGLPVRSIEAKSLSVLAPPRPAKVT